MTTKKQQVYWGWKGEEIELFGEDGAVIFCSHPKHYVDLKTVLAYFSRDGVDDYTPWGKAKAFTKQYGITPTNVAKKFNGIRYSEVVSKHPNWACVVQTKKGHINPGRFSSIESVDLVDQAIKDGLKNITPFIVLYNESPKELKKRFGDNNWKALCKNSFSRNRMIYQVSSTGRFDRRDDPVYNNNYPSTLLKNKWHQRDYRAVKLALQVAGCSMAKMDDVNNIRTLVRVCDIWADTKRMCEARNITFNPNWSWRRIQEEHHNMTTEQQREFQRRQAERDSGYAKLLAIDFRTLHKGLEVIEFDSGVVATPLINIEQVQLQGRREHHCVGSYASSCAHGSYLVWSLKKGVVESTLGINVFEPAGKTFRDGTGVQYVFNQHYHACNKSVEDQDFIDAATEIVKMLNEKNKVEKALDKELAEA